MLIPAGIEPAKPVERVSGKVDVMSLPSKGL